MTAAPNPEPADAPQEFAGYLAALPPERAELLGRVIALVEGALPAGYVRAMEYGMPSWVIPLDVYPDTYNRHPLGVVSLAAQKNYTSLYLNCLPADAADETAGERFRADWAAAGAPRLDMGKSCIRFRRYDDLAPEVIAATIRSTPPAELIARYERSRATAVPAPAPTAVPAPANARAPATTPASAPITAAATATAPAPER
jgi:hypothetical protein